MLRRPTISARYFIALRAFAAARGIDVDALARANDLATDKGIDPESEISFTAFIRLVEAAAAKANDEAFGLHYAEALPPRPSGVFQNIVFNSLTLRDAFQAMIRFIGLVTNAFEMRYEERDGAGWLTFDLPQHLGPQSHFVDGQLAIIALRARQLLGDACMPSQVFLARPHPKSTADYTRMFGPRVQFGAANNRIGYDLDTLSRPLPNADRDLLRAVESYGVYLLGQKLHGQGRASRIATYISQALQRGDATEAAACAALHITPRTLQRELAAEGTSFSALLDETRIKMARHYLIETDLSLTAIAFLLGYSELSAFSRAARAWFDDTPSGYRRKIRETNRDRAIPQN